MRPAANQLLTYAALAIGVASSSRPVNRLSDDRSVRARLTRDSVALPRFERVLLLEKTSETSANVSIGDVNGDGKLDIVLAKGRHWPLVDRVLLGDGAGHFK